MNGFPREIVIDQRETTPIRRHYTGAIRGGTTTSGRSKEELDGRMREKGKGIFQRSFGIVLTFFVLEDVRVLLVNDDATVAGFSGTEKQRSLLFKLLDSISLVGIGTLSLPLSFFSPFFLERIARCLRISLLVKDGVGGKEVAS